MSEGGLEVIVVNRNAGAALARAVASVRDYPVVLVDAASTDDSVAAARVAHPGARVVSLGGNPGFAAAANRGFRETRAAAVLFLNPDAEATGVAVSRMRASLDARPRAGAVGARCVRPDGRPLWSYGPLPTPARVVLATLRLVHGPPPAGGTTVTGTVTGAALLVRREAFEVVGGFDERFFLYYEETDLCRRLAARGWEILHEPAAVVVHAVGGCAADPAERRGWFVDAQLAYLAKHHGVSVARAVSRFHAIRARFRRARHALAGRTARCREDEAVLAAARRFRGDAP